MNTRTMGNSSRLVGRLLLFAWAALFVSVLGAKATPVKTLVQDTLYRADGSAAQGNVTIRWNGFSTSAGEAVAAGQMTTKTDANGGISIPLIPNTGSSPSGSYYRVLITLDDGTASEEVWVVPAVATTTVAAIRAKVVPQAVAAQFASRDYVDSALATIANTTINGFPLSSDVTLSVSNLASGVLPNGTTATTQSANDDSTKVATTQYVNELWATPPAIGSTAPGVVNATEYLVNGIALASGNLGDGTTLARNTSANAFTANQAIKYSGADGTNPFLVDASGSAISGAAAVRIVMPVAGTQSALAVGNTTDANSWFSVTNNADGFVGSSASSGAIPSQPGIEFGAGGAVAHDTFLYRSSAGTLSTPGAFGVGAAMAAQSVNGVANEAGFAGATLAARVLAACQSLAGANGMVRIPSTESDTSSGFGALPDGCTVNDLRGIVYPNYGGYTIASGVNEPRSILYWRQSNTASNSSPTDPTLMHLHFDINSGGINTCCGTGLTKTNYQNLNLTMNARTPGQHGVISSQLNSYSNGDAMMQEWVDNCYGQETAAGDEGCEGLSAGINAGFPALIASVASISGNTLTMTCSTNCSQLGEQMPLLNTSANEYTTGTVSSISGAPPVVTGSGTSWSSLCPGGTAPCNPTNLFFEFTAETVNNVHVLMPVATVTSNTSITLTLAAQGVNESYNGKVKSGAYTIYQGSTITAVPYTAGSFNTIQATVADATQFAAGNSVMEVGAAEESVRGLHLALNQNVPFPGSASSAVLGLSNYGSFPIGDAIVFNGSVSDSTLISNWGGATPNYGFRLMGTAPVNGVLFADDSVTLNGGLTRNNMEAMLSVLNNAGSYDYLYYDRTGGNNRWQLKNLYATGTVNANALQQNGAAVVTQSASGNIVVSGAVGGGYGGIGPYQNMLAYSQFDAGNAAWIAAYGTLPTLTANTADFTDPWGGNTAQRAVMAGISAQGQGQAPSPSMVAGTTYTFSLWARGAVGGEFLRLGIGGGSPYCGGTTQVLTTTWQRYQLACPYLSTYTNEVFWDDNREVGDTIYVAGAQLEANGSAGLYVHTTASPVSPSVGVVANGAPVVSPSNDSTMGGASPSATVPPTQSAVQSYIAAHATLGAQVVISQSSDVANTGFTAQQTLCSLAIPGNATSGTQDSTLSRMTLHAAVTTSGTGQMSLYVGALSASTTSVTAGYLGTATAGAGRTYVINAVCHNRTSSSQICDIAIVDPTNNTTATAIAYSFNTASNMYFVIQGTQTVSTDTTTCRLMEATIK